MNRIAPQGATNLRSFCGWSGLVMLAVGAAAFAGRSGIGRFRIQAIVDNPCIKNSLGTSALETWLTADAAVFLIAAIGAFVVVLVAGVRRQIVDATARHAWGGLALAIVLLLPVANLRRR